MCEFSFGFLCNKSDVKRSFLRQSNKNCTVLVVNGIKKLVLTGDGWGNENGNVTALKSLKVHMD